MERITGQVAPSHFSTRSLVQAVRNASVVVLAAALLGGCGGGSGSSSSPAPDTGSAPRGTTISEANAADVAALAYSSLGIADSMSGMPDDVLGSEQPGEEEEEEPEFSAPARALPRSIMGRAVVDTTPCDTGSYTVTHDDTLTMIEYNDCLQSYAGATMLTDGISRQENLGPSESFETNWRWISESYFHRQQQAGDTVETTIDGEGRYSFTWGLRLRTETDLNYQSRLMCDGLDERYAGQYQFVHTAERDGSDVVSTQNGRMTLNGSEAFIFNGTLTVETLEPVRRALHADHPYSGILRFAASDGSTVVIRYVEGGLYVNDQFYTWDAFNTLVEEVQGDDICFGGDDEVPGEEEPGDETEQTAAVSASIGGETWAATEARLSLNVPVAGAPGVFSLIASRAASSSFEGSAVTITLSHITGPGTYQVDYSEDRPINGVAAFINFSVVSGMDAGAWSTSEAPGGTLTLTIVTLTENRIAGTFSFDGYSNTGDHLSVVNGQFDGAYNVD